MPPDALALIRRAKAEAKVKEGRAQAPNDVKAVVPLPPLSLLHLPALPPAISHPDLPSGSVHYVPDFVTAADEELLLQHIQPGECQSLVGWQWPTHPKLWWRPIGARAE